MLALKTEEKGIRLRPFLAIEKDEVSEALNGLKSR